MEFFELKRVYWINKYIVNYWFIAVASTLLVGDKK